MANRYRRRNTLGTLSTRMRLVIRARRRGSVVRWPLRVPQAACPHPVSRIDIGADTYIGARSWFSFSSPDGQISIGADCVIGESFTVSCGGSVRIGNGTGIGERTTIVDQHHDAEAWIGQARSAGEEPRWNWSTRRAEPVSVGNGCWLGVNVVVMPGVTIGDGCIVGANSVVLSDIPEHSLAAGMPARVIRTIDATDPGRDP